MSKSGWIDIECFEQVDIKKFLEVALYTRWLFEKDKQVWLLPLGDNDFSWECKEYNKKEIFEIIDKKRVSSETVGIVLYLDEVDTGANMLFDFNTPHLISFSISINNKRIENTEITDYSWYLEKIGKIINNLNYTITKIVCEDSF